MLRDGQPCMYNTANKSMITARTVYNRPLQLIAGKLGCGVFWGYALGLTMVVVILKTLPRIYR